ncbi:hypothetical protein [Candidatus Mycoplasma mahonii]|uniref:hypothetical protein n=1 Tax=Candidatus Mycoplasma mahonii TaxID=3004105 RepID=UPI0026EE639C|nr:hypothetical protein [Candidatus Mycoplasma mahonii]WKX02349.1 hypothetical protein O3I44_03020 [Candidatus Mycoplasma mahonii]
MKKLLLTLGSITAVIAPIVAVIACGAKATKGQYGIGIITNYLVDNDRQTITSLTIDLTKYSTANQNLNSEIDLLTHATLNGETSLKIIISHENSLEQKIMAEAPEIDPANQLLKKNHKFRELIDLLKFRTALSS